MPIFEYQCGECGHVTEFLERRDSSAGHECEKCHGRNMSRVMSVFSASMDGKSISKGGGSCSSCNSGNCSSCHK